MKKVIINIGIIGLVGFFVYCQMSQAKNISSPQKVQERTLVPSIIEIQEMLNEAEPKNPLVLDGKIGKKTLEKWERVYCNQMAEKIDGRFYNEIQTNN